MTPAQLKALRWFAENGEVYLFPNDGPSSTVRRRLLASELVECGTGHRRPGEAFAWQTYRISEAGKKALEENSWL